ncbi:MAG TPA: hypothetical protein VGN11_08350 [Candidatus Baltobacteraceae bacterium]|nr:hypothetical protein [Candidatus Baltobacteraceae bacterium]
MTIKKALAALALTGAIGFSVPAVPALADGAASTRNIIFGAAAATGAYLIIQHNRKVHERYAEDARRQAALSQESNDAWAAYHQEQRAYQQQVAVNGELKKEIAYQHRVVQQQSRQLASLNMHRTFAQNSAPQRSNARVASRGNQSKTDVAMVSYGWGDI